MKGETPRSIEFLEKFYPKGPWLLTAISTDRKGVETAVFGPNTLEPCRNWIEKYNGDRNIYFTVNRPQNAFFKQDRIKKPNKVDMWEAGWLHVDIDPAEGQDIAEEQERALGQLTDKLPKGIPEPTVILFSGGGFQAFWKLDKAVQIDGNEEKWTDFELYNKRLEQIFGGDHCHNVDRIMRLPGTVNVPDAKKRKKGRVETLAKLLQFNAKNVYSIDQFKKAQGVQGDFGTGRVAGAGAKVNIPGNVVRIEDPSELDKYQVPDRLKIIMVQGMHPDEPKEKDNSRSAWLFDFCCGMVRCNVPDEVIYAILTDPEWGISESVLENKARAEQYAIRQIGRAKEYAETPGDSDDLVWMNDRHAVIGNISGKCRVIEEVPDDQLNRTKLTYSSFEDIRNRYSNRKVQVGTSDKGAPVVVDLGKFWLNHPMRRQYDTIKFMPNQEKEGVYNLWRGFSYAAQPGDCSLFLEHLRVNVCQGVEENYTYVINWMARVVQFPASPGEVAIVLRGGKGTGKGTVAKYFGALFGRHHVHIGNAKHLVGQFNAHLKDCVSLFADEAFFAGDKQHESVLKMLITEQTIPIEQKGIDVEPYPNYVHLIMASNDPHVIRATGDERRYCVLDIGTRNQQDSAFFGAMDEQMENGGYEALLYHLQSIDITDFNVRKVPQTDALREQKDLSLSREEEWFYQKLQDGRLVEQHPKWQGAIPTKQLEEDFTSYTQRWQMNHRGNATQLGKFLKRMFPHLIKNQQRMTVENYDSEGRSHQVKTRVNVYDFGTLEQCRSAWEVAHGKTEWEELPYDDELGEIEKPF